MPPRVRRRFPQNARPRRRIRIPQIFKVGGFFFLCAAGAFTAWAMLVTLPSIDNFQNRKVAESTKIYDRTGNVLLYDVHGSMRRTAVALADMSPFIRSATIAIEDADFYQHKGVRPLSFMRAVLVNLMNGGYTQGGSTITQQVVKNTLLTQDKTILRKFKEIILALKLERAVPKDKILEIYLNDTSYGGTIYGVEEASQYFFATSSKDVTLAEAAYLAALPQAPTRYSPYGNHRDELDKRKNLVLSRMKDTGYINDEQLKAAQAEQVTFSDTAEAGIKAPHFVFYIREYLEQKYGADAVANEGLRVVTTLDYDLQKKAEDVVAKYAPNMEKNFNASNEGMVAIDPKSGQVLAMVGSRGYFDEHIDGKVNVTLANRQPGSSFKPFVYATAFQKGYTPDTVVFDAETQFSTACSPADYTNDAPPCYSPSNYDGKFKGPMTLRNAIAQSQNVPSVKTLYLAGIQNAIDLAVNMGITTLADAGRYGLTLVLGGGEVNLLDMTGAYAAFGNDGVKNPPTGILEVSDAGGTELEKYKDTSSRVIDPEIARMMNDVLSDNVARTPEFGADSPLFFPEADVADKTGTTNDFRDVWVLGYTPGISIGAWAGNNDNSPMVKKIAAFIIAPMWHEFMAYALTKYPSDGFPPMAPDPDKDSLPPVLRGNWNTDPSQGVHEILYWIDKSNPRAGRLANPSADPQFAYWEYPISGWASQNQGSTTPLVENYAPRVSGDLEITSPQANAWLPSTSAFTASIRYPAGESPATVTYYLNGSLVGTSSQQPYSVTIAPNGKGPSVLRVVYQSPSGTKEQTVHFTLQ